MRTVLKTVVMSVLIAGVTVGCKKEDPVAPTPSNPPVNEQELITTVKLHFHSADGTEHKHFIWRDLDGDGGAAPVITYDTLTAGTVYEVSIELLDESQNPAEDITEEVEEEGDEHQFFFVVTGANMGIVYMDADANGDPIGITSMWSAGMASTGTVTVILRHELDKDAPGVSGGDITNAGGDTDVEVTFPLVIQ
ncbi:MAG: type 1 periplasmic binding fold superfamily protein [Flavobacteriales bacterium]|nr:type 1 periplasmic binding fold superfamily protein [Flavobacteriales bacterium]